MAKSMFPHRCIKSTLIPVQAAEISCFLKNVRAVLPSFVVP